MKKKWMAALALLLALSWTALAAGSTEKVGESSLNCGSEDGVRVNVSLAASSVNDTTLSTGDTFSFNSVVGPREERYGYVEATDGKGDAVVGGGADQVASAVWLAIKNVEGVVVVEKTTYGADYDQSYVDRADNAIFTDAEARTDFSFRYDGEGELTLYVALDGGSLRCEAYLSL